MHNSAVNCIKSILIFAWPIESEVDYLNALPLILHFYLIILHNVKFPVCRDCIVCVLVLNYGLLSTYLGYRFWSTSPAPRALLLDSSIYCGSLDLIRFD